MKPETRFRLRLDKKLKEIKNSWWESIQQVAIRGTPDKLGCVNGTFVALELKASQKGVVSRMQKLKLDKILAAGGRSFVVYPENMDAVLDELNRIGVKNDN